MSSLPLNPSTVVSETLIKPRNNEPCVSRLTLVERYFMFVSKNFSSHLYTFNFPVYLSWFFILCMTLLVVLVGWTYTWERRQDLDKGLDVTHLAVVRDVGEEGVPGMVVWFVLSNEPLRKNERLMDKETQKRHGRTSRVSQSNLKMKLEHQQLGDDYC